MPTPITGLPGELTTLADNDLFVVDDTSEVETKKITAANLRTAMQAGFQAFGHVWTEGSITLPDANTIVDVGDTASLTLPAASAGRIYILRLLSTPRKITLIPQSGEPIDFVEGNRVLPGGISNSIGVTDVSEDPPVWIVTGTTEDGPGWMTSTVPGRSVTSDEAPAGSNDSTQGFGVGTVWRQVVDDVTTGTWICLDNTEDEAVWHRLGTGDGTTDGWSMQTSTATTVNVVTPFPMGGLILRLGLTGNTTVNLPYGNGGEVLLITVSNSGHSTVTLHPFSGTTVQYGTADYRLPNVRVYTPGPTATQPTISYLLIHNGSTWVLVAPAVPTQGAIPNGYAVPMVPDCDVCLLNSGGGNVSYPMPAVVVGVPHLMLLKKTSTDTYTTTFTPSGAELIEGSNSSFLLPGSAATDRPSWTWYRDLDGNWWLL
ncbi:MAG: hypothetical protein J0L92_01010 [Deltaproteobacteria bacterium]|nr:hypothetical protein [Deltaproteobacteria bacterium]